MCYASQCNSVQIHRHYTVHRHSRVSFRDFLYIKGVTGRNIQRIIIIERKLSLKYMLLSQLEAATV